MTLCPPRSPGRARRFGVVTGEDGAPSGSFAAPGHDQLPVRLDDGGERHLRAAEIGENASGVSEGRVEDTGGRHIGPGRNHRSRWSQRPPACCLGCSAHSRAASVPP